MTDTKGSAESNVETTLTGEELVLGVDAPLTTPVSAVWTADTQALRTFTAYSIDEDDQASDSAVKLPTQQSVKAYVDNQVRKVQKTIWNPVAVQGEDTQVPIFRADAAITITRIHISGPNASPGAELDIDLKWADDTTAWTNGAVIDVCDTTNGVVTITSGMDDPTVASGKYIYWEFGAAPNIDWRWFYFEIYYTYD